MKNIVQKDEYKKKYSNRKPLKQNMIYIFSDLPLNSKDLKKIIF